MAMRKRNVDERAAKLTRAKDRIVSENKSRIERALSAMSFARENNNNTGHNIHPTTSASSNQLEHAPPHLRPLLKPFLRPAFRKSFLAYADGEARGGAATRTPNVDGARKNGDVSSALGSLPAISTAPAEFPPARRAASLDFPGKRLAQPATVNAVAAVASTAAAVASGDTDTIDPLASDAEGRRQAAFGDVPPIQAAADLLAAELAAKAQSSPLPADVGGSGGGGGGGGSGGGGTDGTGRKHSAAGGNRGGRKTSASSKWRTHGEGSGIDLTLTANTDPSADAGSVAAGANGPPKSFSRSSSSVSSGRGSRGGRRSRSGSAAGSERTKTAVAAAAAAAVAAGRDRDTIVVRMKELEERRVDLEKREVCTGVRVRL